jgi:hypothetical protein
MALSTLAQVKITREEINHASTSIWLKLSKVLVISTIIDHLPAACNQIPLVDDDDTDDPSSTDNFWKRLHTKKARKKGTQLYRDIGEDASSVMNNHA